ncbi:MAG: DNA primase family protein [Xanthobacteraceae bacterium]
MTDKLRPILSRGTPRDSAKAFCTWNRPNLIRQQQDWLDWNGRAYDVIEDDTIRADIAAWLDTAFEEYMDESSGKKNRRFKPKPTDVSSIYSSLESLVHKRADTFSPPCWLDAAANRPDPLDLISCESGLVDMRTRKLYKHTPAFFTLNSIPLVYDPTAPRPKLWLKCLDQWFECNAGLIALLQELFGYTLSGDTSQHVAPFLWGVPRGGKSTVLRVLTDLVGRANTHSPSIKELSGRFGLWGCLGKSLITITDMDIDSRTEIGNAATSIKAITGEDMISVERKNKDPWAGLMAGRIWLAANGLPDFGSHASAICTRVRVLPFFVSFLGREDRDLTNRRGTGKLQMELPGILNWALDGLDRLRENGRFTECIESESAKNRMLYQSQPIRGMVEDLCELRADVHIDKAVLYSVYVTYCNGAGERPISSNKFAEKLLEIYSVVGSSRRSIKGSEHRPPIFAGIRLKEREAMKMYRIATEYTIHDIEPGLGIDFWAIAARDDDGEPILRDDVHADFGP